MAEAVPKKLIQQLVFGGDVTAKDSIEEEFELHDEKTRSSGRPSAYVDVFEGIVKTVIENEYGLLSQQELNALEHFGRLCYNARYCLARLVLRKPNTWHPISSLESFKKGIEEKDGLHRALADLCKPIRSLFDEGPSQGYIKEEPVDVKPATAPEIIDLSIDDDIKQSLSQLNGSTAPETAHPVHIPVLTVEVDPLQAVIDSDPAVMNLDYFCEDETSMTLDEALYKLTNVQLQQLLKTMKCKSKSTNKSDMIYALLLQASTQSVLNFGSAVKNKGKSKDNGMRQTQLFIPVKTYSKAKSNQQDRLKEVGLKTLGKCIRVNFDFFRLVRRLHIIYYREIEHPTALLLPSLLTKFKKWSYTQYNTARSTDIWESRHDYLDYEKALEIEYNMLQILEPPPEKPGRKATKTPARVLKKFTTPMTPRLEGSPNTRLKPPRKTPRSVSCFTPNANSPSVNGIFLGDPDEDQDFVPEIKKEERVKEYLEKYIYPIWREHLVARSVKEFEEFPDRSPGLQRFETGYVYTRMVYKATKALGPLKEYNLELQMIEELLSQRFWNRGRRGKLYERRAILLGHLTSKAVTAAEKKDLLYRLAEGLKEALMDADTGIVFRPNLMKRLMAVEKRSKTPEEERSQCAGELREAKLVELRAVRVHDSLLLDGLGRPINVKENEARVDIRSYGTSSKGTSSTNQLEPDPPPPKKWLGQKSRWQSRDGHIVDVETRALEFYEDQGFRGFHSETQILTTLFGLLFWDIIFADIPGAFETAFQKAPLDICEDSFYYARKNPIDERLNEIRAGKAQDILQRHDDQYREKKTQCLCVKWDFCTKEDLLEIVGCMNAESLVTICILFCQDYRGRSSGGPDLFVWNSETHACKFVEVKGPGDVARENQKLWFDSLLRAEVDVDLCKVIDINAKPSISNIRKRKAKAQAAPRRRKAAGVDNNHSEEEDYDQLDLESEADNDLQPEVVQANISTPSKRRRISASPHTPRHSDGPPFVLKSEVL